jgi:flagellar hook-basal body complex protein FliE
MKFIIITLLAFYTTILLGQNSTNSNQDNKNSSNSFQEKLRKAEPSKNAERKGVHDALVDYIEAFYEGDSTKIIRSISPTVTKYGYMKSKKTNEYEGFAMPFDQMIKWVNTKSKVVDAKFSKVEKVEIYEVQDKTASGKVTAWWGTDYVLLEKIDAKWFLKMILWQGPLKETKK